MARYQVEQDYSMARGGTRFSVRRPDGKFAGHFATRDSALRGLRLAIRKAITSS